MRLPRDTRMPLNGAFRFGTGALAATGSGQSTAAAIVSQVTYVSAADGTKAVALPAADLGRSFLVINTSASASLPVYPASGDAINDGAADAAFTLGPKGAQWFVATSSSQWYTQPMGALAATPTEVDRMADVSARLVPAGSTLAVTVAAHADKEILLNTATGSVCTLPAATGSGARFMFRVSVLATSNSHIIKVANANDIMQGILELVDTDTAGTVTGFATAADSDTITLNRSTTGSAMRGEWVEVIDAAANLWLVRGQLANTGSGATPFSAGV